LAQLTDYEQKSLQRLGETIMEGKWSNEGMVEAVKLLFDFLNPIPLQDYANKEGITYPGALKRNVHTELLGRRFFLDNY
jgi:hypothetical protein